jgi:predicted dehydrogenase
MVLDPGHFHAGLVQKTMYEEVDSVVQVFAPDGPDVQNYLDQVEAYNNRETDPTHWVIQLYKGPDFFSRMLDEGTGNVLVLAGNNRKKTEYILEAVKSGIHVLADKPMAIDTDDYERLQEAFEVAQNNGLLIYDIMTERFEITTLLQKKFSQIPGVFGDLQNGSPDDPAVIKESVHHFYKYVSGNILKRPPWFFDVRQQGEGIVDVTTHLIDLVQWACFPEQVIRYRDDIQLLNATRWPTILTPGEFQAVTRLDRFPDYLQNDRNESGQLEVYANGEINYSIKGVHARVRVTWNFKAPEEAGDAHYSIMRGTRSNLVIRQGVAEDHRPTLYIEPVEPDDVGAIESSLTRAMVDLLADYPDLELEITRKGWKIVIPESYRIGHEAHFGQVTRAFLDYLEAGRLPEWAVPNMLAKYYITTQALEIANKNTP